uniref:Uncharacterized protein n=1 Tax=Ceratitis capitata TaxID=7213 RepID=W8C7W4_CERCA
MCSKRCKHSLKDRVPTCGLERKQYESHIAVGTCMLQKEDSVDCDKCRPLNGTIEHICMCKPEQSGSKLSSQHEATTIADSQQPLLPQQQNSTEFQESNENTGKEIPAEKPSLKAQHSNNGLRNRDQMPTHISYMDEWEAMGIMLATNGRIWGLEDRGFARQYKAALSAINTKFEEEAANMTGHATY